jgi:hypothetical protein
MTSKLRFIPKARTRPDCLPIDTADWNAMPPAVEQAYRRGFVQGFLDAVRYATEGRPLDELKRFGYGPLRQWRFADRMRYETPPAFEQGGRTDDF